MSLLIKLFFLWRSNDLKSILFKCCFWGGLAWLLVGIFTSFNTAIIAGGAIAALAAVKYLWQERSENQKMLDLVGGDKAKLKAMKKGLNKKGMGGAMMKEMLRAAADEQDWDDEEEIELTEEEIASNKKATQETIAKMNRLCAESGLVTAEHCAKVSQELNDEYADGDDVPSQEYLLSEFLPENTLEICAEDFCNDDDHASVVDMFAEATNGNWKIEDCTSSYDEETERWTVKYKEAGKMKGWRFQQSGDWLSNKFLNQVIQQVQAQTGYVVTVLDAEDFISVVCLPRELHGKLLGDNDALAA